MKKGIIFFLNLFSLFSLTILYAKPEIVVQESPSGSVRKIVFSKDGDFLCTSSGKEVHVFDLKTGGVLKTFEVFDFCDFSPDGTCILYRPSKTSLELLNIVTGDRWEIEKNPPHEESEESYVSFSPDGKYFAVTNFNKISLYDARELKKIKNLEIPGLFFIDEIKFSSDSMKLSTIGRPDPQNKHGNAILDNNSTYIVWNLDNFNTKLVSDFFNSKCFTDFNQLSNCFAFATRGFISINDIDSGYEYFITNYSSYDDGNLTGLSFSADGKYLYVLQEKLLTILQNKSSKESENNWIILQKKQIDYTATSLAVCKERSLYAIGAYRQIGLYDTKTNKLINVIEGVSKLSQLHQNLSNETFIISSNQLDVRGYIDSNAVYHSLPSSLAITRNASFVSLFNDGFYYRPKQKDDIYRYIYSTDKLQKLPAKSLEFGKIRNVVSNDDGNLFFFQKEGDYHIYLWDVDAGKKIDCGGYRESTGITVKNLNPISSKFSHTNRYAFLKETDNIINNTALYDIKKKEKIKIPIKMVRGDFSQDDKIFATEKIGGGVDVLNLSSFKILKTFEDSYNPFFSSDGKYLGMILYENSFSRNIAVYSTKNWNLVKKICIPRSFIKAYFSKDGTKIISLDTSGVLRYYSIDEGNLAFSVLIDKDDDCFYYVPDGYFNCSEKNINKFVRVVDGMKITELEQIAETFYRPDIIVKNIQGKEKLNSKEETNLSDIISTGNEPIVQFEATPTESVHRDITVTFSVQDNGGGIGAVYMSVNGKVQQLSDGIRKLELVGGAIAQTYDTTKTSVTYRHNITLSDGENIIEAYAMNKAEKIASFHARLSISWKGNVSKPNLYVLAVGVNKYSTKGVSKLNYAVPDVQSIASTFKSTGKNLYGNVNVSMLTDEEATSSSIAGEFSRLSNIVKPDDVFVFYVSGHGTSYNGDYYFIPVNFNGNLSTAISKTFIMNNMQKIAAQKSLLILDTCYSGAIVNESDTTAYQRLAYATGQAIIAASSDAQTAIEGYEGHGVFTYTILQGLSGKAGTVDEENISLLDLAAYVSKSLPKLSKQKWNYVQMPWFDIRKQDFPLVTR